MKYSVADIKAMPAAEVEVGDIIMIGKTMELVTGWFWGAKGQINLLHGNAWHPYSPRTVLEVIPVDRPSD